MLGVFFVLLLVLALGWRPIFSGMGRVAHLFGLPLWHVETTVAHGVSLGEDEIRPKSALIDELIDLRAQVTESDAKVKSFDALVDENLHLKDELGRKVATTTVLARVVSRPPFSVYDTLVIDAGTREGVQVGALVYAAGPYVVGVVTRAEDLSSVVTLASAPGQSHTVMIEALPEAQIFRTASSTSSDGLDVPNDQEVTMVGQGGGGFVAEVPKQLKFAPGTPIMLETLSPSVIGNVTSEFMPADGSMKEVYGAFPFGLRSLEWVNVSLTPMPTSTIL